MSGRSVRYALVVAVITLVAASSFFGGVLSGRALEGWRVPPVPGGAPERSDLGRAVDEAQGIIERQALNPSDEESMTLNTLQGLLDSLGDRHALYFDARHYGYFNEQNAGEFGGIGVTLQQKNGQVEVVEIFPGTPAEKAGIKPADIFYGIDGERRDSWDSDAVVSRVRGEEGTPVKLEMKREGEKEPLAFTIVRARIDIPNVESRMIGSDMGYVSVASFNERATEEVAAAMEDLEKQGAKGHILDLRNNPGGMLDEAVEMTSLFVKDGLVVRVEYRGRAPQEYRVSGRQGVTKRLVVLVNENSASASEIVAGALQDHSRARVVGVKTFGKGSVQTVEELSAGGAIKFTVAHYLTPKGRAIDGVGLTPDTVVEMKPELAMDEKTDTQLKKAIEVLRAAL